MDYRRFLNDLLTHCRDENPAFSMRALAAKINCNPGFFNRILKGARNLSNAYIVELGKVFKLTKREIRYFELLAAYTHAKKQSERDYFLEQLLQLKKTHLKQITADQYTLYSHWYYLVIRELLSILPAASSLKEYAQRIAQTLEPQISQGEIRDALDHLLRLGIISRAEDGSLSTRDEFTASGNTVPQVIVNRFLLEFTDLASRSIDAVPKTDRRLSTLTFSVSRKGFETISERINEFRQEVMSIVEHDSDSLESVYHINLQLFPVTRRQEEMKQ
jgi:uncharacterized protein (TIGR02147 family)